MGRATEVGAARRATCRRAARRRCSTRRPWCCRWPGVIDLDAEREPARQGPRAKAVGEAQKVAQKLDNADFVRRAPEEVVEENRERLAAFEQEIARLEAAIARITPVPA